jgi:hypothetical protein
MALDDVLREAYPNMAQGNDAGRILVTMNNVRLVRSPHTTLEELGVPHQAELKIEPSGVAPTTPSFGSIGDTIASEPMHYNVLFNLMNASDNAIPTLVWDVLMSLPTSLQEMRRVQVCKYTHTYTQAHIHIHTCICIYTRTHPCSCPSLSPRRCTALHYRCT